MFAAYSEDRKNADDRTRYQEQQSDLQVRTRWAVQQASKKETERIAQKTLQNQEKMVIQQIGFGESDDEDGGPRIELPEEHQKHSDEVFLAPEVRRQANM
uniref:Uncharacterized protein n=1 Tax=Caenorhabditis japonica TaxID=281687 RepID=A0A8R1EA69_CAEJA